MSTTAQPRGPWIHRLTVRLLTVILAVLVYWVLGFLVQDIGAIRGPQRHVVEQRYVDANLVDTQQELSAEIATVDREIQAKRDEMSILRDSSQNLQKTIGQLVELQKLALQKSVALSPEEQTSLSDSQTHFLESQKAYQAHNRELAELTDRRRSLDDQRRAIQTQIEAQRRPAQQEYERLTRRHRLRLAALQLAILLPLLATGAWLVLRRRASPYFPAFLAYALAVLVKITVVMHHYFPSRIFKYVLVGGLLLAVLRALIHFIRVVARPRDTWLAKQYREAYERFLCPVCEYPIRTGPRRFLFWTRRSLAKVKLPPDPVGEEPYTCPACGTGLYETCAACGQVRHTLLSHCQHCGDEGSQPNTATTSPASS